MGCDTRESATSGRVSADKDGDDSRGAQIKSMKHLKRGWLALLLIVVSLGPLAGCVARRSKAALLSYSRVLKPGMTRKEVEDYFRTKKVKFNQTCCVQGPYKRSPDDLIEIWTFHSPLPCDNQPHYVAFIFNDQTQHPLAAMPQAGVLQADDLDTLRSIITFDGDIDCF